MPNYSYRARDASGQPVSGRIYAPSEREAVERLRSEGRYVTYIDLYKDLKELLRPRAPAAGGGRIRLKELALFCRQFSTMIGAGMTILSSLRILADQAGSRKLKRAVTQLADDLETGETLSGAFRRQEREFSPVLLNMVATGEAGGFLEEVFERLAVHFEKEEALAQKIRSAMVYPIAVMVVAVGVVGFMVTFVVPNYVNLFIEMEASLPLPTRMVLALSNAVRNYWYLVMAGAVALGIGLKASAGSKTMTGFLDRWSLRLPVFGELLSKKAYARFARTLSTLLRSGVPVLDAISVSADVVRNEVLAGALRRVQEAIRDGENIARPMRETGAFPEMMIEMIGVGEETGAVEEMLARLADFYDREIDRTVERLTALIEPLIIVVLGVVVGFILISIVMPMFDVFTMLKP